MRVTLDVSDVDGHMVGQVEPGNGREPVDFSGVFALVSTLEELLAAAGAQPAACRAARRQADAREAGGATALEPTT